MGACVALRLLAMGESPRNVIPNWGYTVPTPYIFQYPVHMVQWSTSEDCDYDFTLPSPSKVESATVERTG